MEGATKMELVLKWLCRSAGLRGGSSIYAMPESCPFDENLVESKRRV